MKNKIKNSGFTLIELMVTLAIATILITVAIPGFRTLIQGNRATAQSNELLSAFSLARSEAVKRGLRVSVCSSTDQATCAASTNWATGWIVFTDDTGTAGTMDGTDEIIRVWDALNGLTLTGTTNNVQFLGSGLVNAGSTLTLTPTDCTGNQRRTLSITAVGRASISDTACP